MGDVVSLVEKLQTGMEDEEARRMGERMMANKFDFNDFLKQIRFLSKLGGLTGMVKMMPGAAQGLVPCLGPGLDSQPSTTAQSEAAHVLLYS